MGNSSPVNPSTASTPVSCTSQHESLAPSAAYGLAFGSWHLISAPCLPQTFLWVHGPISSPGLCCWSWADEWGRGKEVQASICRNQKSCPQHQCCRGQRRKPVGSSLNKIRCCGCCKSPKSGIKSTALTAMSKMFPTL